MGQREDEMLRVCIDHAEREGAMVVAPVDWILRHVMERVMHPTHVPLERESEPAFLRWSGHTWECGGLLRDSDGAAAAMGNDTVEMLEELDSLKILPPSVLIRNPFALPAAVISVEHRCDRIDPECIHMKALNPIKSA